MMNAPFGLMPSWMSSIGPEWAGVMLAVLAVATAGLVLVTHRRTSLDAPRRPG
jgi:hypothetical protein